ncbi:hypothetical protein ACFLX7_01410 [Chloroflexota bacterium]
MEYLDSIGIFFGGLGLFLLSLGLFWFVDVKNLKSNTKAEMDDKG